MDRVAALKTLLLSKTQSLQDLEDLYQSKCFDESKYNELVEDVCADFDRTKDNLLKPSDLKTIDSAPQSVVIATSPVSTWQS